MCSTCGLLARDRLGVERGSLADAETMLLVDHRHGQAAEVDRLLDQRVGPDQQRELAARQLAQQVGPPAPRRRSGQQPERNRLASDQRLDRGEVLLGERLGGRHQRALIAVLDRAQQRVERDHRLARAHLSHQQSLHRPRLGEVVVELRDRRLLVAGEAEREHRRKPARGQLTRLVEHRGDHAASAQTPAAQEGQLGKQQLVEGEPPASQRLLSITLEVRRR